MKALRSKFNKNFHDYTSLIALILMSDGIDPGILDRGWHN